MLERLISFRSTQNDIVWFIAQKLITFRCRNAMRKAVRNYFYSTQFCAMNHWIIRSRKPKRKIIESERNSAQSHLHNWNEKGYCNLTEWHEHTSRAKNVNELYFSLHTSNILFIILSVASNRINNDLIFPFRIYTYIHICYKSNSTCSIRYSVIWMLHVFWIFINRKMLLKLVHSYPKPIG